MTSPENVEPRWFVILRDQRGNPMPLMTEQDDGGESLALFESDDAATDAARNNIVGQACGWETYQW